MLRDSSGVTPASRLLPAVKFPVAEQECVGKGALAHLLL